MADIARKAAERVKSQRLEARVTPDQKALIRRAAEMEGRSVADYVTASLQEAAQRTVEAHDVIELSARDSRAFAEAMLNPPPINDRLKDSIRRYRAARGI